MAEYWGYETTLARDDGAGGFTEIAQIRDLDGPSMARDSIETTHRGTSKLKTFIAGLQDNGEVSFDIVYDPSDATHTELQTDLDAGTNQEYQITFPDASTVTFDAFVMELGASSPLADVMTADVTLKISGGIVWA